MTNPQAIVATSMLLSAAIGSALAFLLLVARKRTLTLALRVALLAAVVVIILATPWFTDFLLLRLNSTTGLSRIWIDLGYPGIVVPAIVVALVSVGTAWSNRSQGA